MRQLITKHIIHGRPLKSVLLLYSPLIIGLIFFFVEPMLIGRASIVPIAAYFFPFPFLLLLLLWMDTTHDELLAKIDFAPNLNTSRFKKKIITLSIWTLAVLSVQTLFTEPIMSLNINGLSSWIFLPLTVIYTIEMVCMLISFSTFYHASHFVGKLAVVVDTQSPFDKNDKGHQGYRSVGHIWPFRYLKTQKQLKAILDKNLR